MNNQIFKSLFTFEHTDGVGIELKLSQNRVKLESE